MSAPLIIGGGPAGAAAAIVLAAAGKRPTVLERSPHATDKVCGDFLSGEAIAVLRALGIDIAQLGAVNIHCVRLVHGKRSAEASLPFPAAGLSRRILDQALLALAGFRGATIALGSAVRHLSIEQSGATASLRSGARLTAPAVFLATGKHDLRGWPRQARRAAGSVGLKTYLTLHPDQAAELAGTVELVLFPGGYAGLQSVENGRAALCALVPRGSVCGLSDLPTILAGLSPHLQRRLQGAKTLLPRPLAVAGLPYGHLCTAASQPRLYRLGDQAAVIPSFTGDGVAIALASGALAAESWLRGESAALFHSRLATLLRTQMGRANLIHFLCRSAALQLPVVLACSRFPSLIGYAARATRIACAITDAEERLSWVASPRHVPQKREAEGDRVAPCASAG